MTNTNTFYTQPEGHAHKWGAHFFTEHPLTNVTTYKSLVDGPDPPKVNIKLTNTIKIHTIILVPIPLENFH